VLANNGVIVNGLMVLFSVSSQELFGVVTIEFIEGCDAPCSGAMSQMSLASPD
jgi:hypothetical protein